MIFFLHGCIDTVSFIIIIIIVCLLIDRLIPLVYFQILENKRF